jgi:hypothetical protein
VRRLNRTGVLHWRARRGWVVGRRLLRWRRRGGSGLRLRNVELIGIFWQGALLRSWCKGRVARGLRPLVIARI